MKETYEPIDEKCFLPVMDEAYTFLGRGTVRSTALGNPFELKAIEAILKFEPPWEKERDPITDPLESSLLHERHSRIERLIEPPQAVYRFNFRWDHSNYAAIDLDTLDGDFSDITNWHSPIFQSAGAAIIEALWSRVLAGLDKR